MKCTFPVSCALVATLMCFAGCTTPPDPFRQNQRLGRGINLGNALEAPEEGTWGVTLQPEYFQIIRSAGFDSVRIPIRWSAHADEEPPYTIDPAFFDRVDWAVKRALAAGLTTVINVHHYKELMAHPQDHQARFLALWKQIAEHYKNYPDVLMLEIVNEPNDKLTPELWNELLAKAIAGIRNVDPGRTLVVGTASWGGFRGLASLQLPPEERNLIVTFHYYEPFHFTHQGASWVKKSDPWLGTTWQATDTEREAVVTHLDTAAAWGEQHGRPLWMGEFGAYEKADLASRVRWTSFIAREAEKRGIVWSYWEFCAGFGAYDPSVNAWRRELLEALVPEVY